jgi:AraC-like DNA-binding protein
MVLLDQAGAGISRLQLLSPSPGLEPFVEHFWVERGPVDVLGRAWRIVPDTCPHLIFVVSKSGSQNCRPSCTLVGARSRFADISTDGRTFTCGARLRPGTLPLLTRLPAWDFTDRGASSEEVFGTEGRTLLEQLADLGPPVQVLGVMAQFLGDRFGDHCHVRLPPTPCNNQVQELAAQLSVPVRTLHNQMMQDIGISPKRWLRIQRLHRVLDTCRKRPARWGEVAATHGFADQAHMVRDFRDLLGDSPTAWTMRGLPICSRH